MAERQAELLQMLIAQLEQRLAVDGVAGEQLGILAEALASSHAATSDLIALQGRQGRNVQPKYGLRPVGCRRHCALRFEPARPGPPRCSPRLRADLRLA